LYGLFCFFSKVDRTTNCSSSPRLPLPPIHHNMIWPRFMDTQMVKKVLQACKSEGLGVVDDPCGRGDPRLQEVLETAQHRPGKKKARHLFGANYRLISHLPLVFSTPMALHPSSMHAVSSIGHRTTIFGYQYRNYAGLLGGDRNRSPARGELRKWHFLSGSPKSIPQ
jgi:hypothetical protein